MILFTRQMRKAIKSTTGVKMKKLRKARGFQAKWVAGKMEISPQYLSDLEHDRRRWTPALIAKFKELINRTYL